MIWSFKEIYQIVGQHEVDEEIGMMGNEDRKLVICSFSLDPHFKMHVIKTYTFDNG